MARYIKQDGAYPKVGPPTTAKAYPTIADPLCEGDQISPKTPPVLVTGADPNKPAKNLVIRIVWISFAVAHPKEKQAAMKYGTNTAGFLPYLNSQIRTILVGSARRLPSSQRNTHTSLNGAHNKGPSPKPTNRKVVPRIPTSFTTPYSSLICSVAGL